VTGRWWLLLAVALLVGVVEWLAVATDADPQPVLLAALVMAACAIAWGVRGAALSVASAVDWPAPYPDEDVSTDWQVAALKSRIAHGSEDASADAQLRARLVELVDARLRTEHGVDRRRDPDAARAILGDELWAFVSATNAGRSRGQRRDLERLVALIETT